MLLDTDWSITFANAAARRISHVSPRHINGISFWDIYPEILGTAVEEACRDVMTHRRERTLDTFFYAPFKIWLSIDVLPLPEGGIALYYHDITAAHAAETDLRIIRDQQKLREDRLRGSEERYRILTELSPQCLWTATPQGHLDYANQRFLRYLGLDAIPSDGSAFLSRIDPSDLDRTVHAWTVGVAGGSDYVLDTRLIRASDRASRWWHISASPLRDDAGNIRQWLGTATDIHEDRLATALLREQYAEIERQSRELETIYRSSPVGMALYEPTELRAVRVNTRQAEIFRMSPADVLGQRYEDLTSGVPAAHALLRRAANGETVLNQNLEGTFDRLPHEHRFWNVSYSPIFDEDGNVRAIAAATIETTLQKRSEAALMESEKLAVVGRMASSIAHEINNPLESVTNLIYIARQNALNPEVQHLLDLADRELRRVSIITNQTLRFHRQASAPSEITCLELFTTVLSLYEGRLRNSSITIEKRKRAERSITCFEGDIRQVLNNLVANAIDAMPSGGRLFLRSREATDWRTGRRGLVLTVADNGTGISPETQASVFKAFFTTKGINGTGLGLWIGSEIVARHDGRLHLRSSQHPTRHGTVFNLFLPFTPRLLNKSTTHVIQ